MHQMSATSYLQIRAGTGGDEAALFAGDLLRMYERAAALRSWRFEVHVIAWYRQTSRFMCRFHCTQLIRVLALLTQRGNSCGSMSRMRSRHTQAGTHIVPA